MSASVSSAMSTSGQRAQREISETASEAQYVSSNCVVYTYYSDVGAVIDEHFSKALNTSGSSFAGDKPKGEKETHRRRRSRDSSLPAAR